MKRAFYYRNIIRHDNSAKGVFSEAVSIDIKMEADSCNGTCVLSAWKFSGYWL